MCTNIQALVNPVVLTPASCPAGVCVHGENDFWLGAVEFAVKRSQRYVWVECLRSRHETCESRGSELEVFLWSPEPTFLVGWFLLASQVVETSAIAWFGQGEKKS